MISEQTKTSKLRRWIILTLFFIILIGSVRLYFRITDDFRIANISHEIPYHPEWETPQLTVEDQKELNTVLQQKFFYLGKGAQSYVFASEDSRYVIKFFKFKHLKPSLLVSLLPNVPPFTPFLQRTAVRKQKKFDSIFTGYRLAFDLNRQESGLFFMQLNPSRQQKFVTVVDKIGFERTIDIGTLPYIIQRKGETLRTILAKNLDQNDLSLAKQNIDKIFNLYLSEYRKGIYDRDHGVLHNTGFQGDAPLHLDVGKLSKDDRIKNPVIHEQDLTKVAARMIPWLQNNYPNHSIALINHMETRLAAIFGHDIVIPQYE